MVNMFRDSSVVSLFRPSLNGRSWISQTLLKWVLRDTIGAPRRPYSDSAEVAQGSFQVVSQSCQEPTYASWAFVEFTKGFPETPQIFLRDSSSSFEMEFPVILETLQMAFQLDLQRFLTGLRTGPLECLLTHMYTHTHIHTYTHAHIVR